MKKFRYGNIDQIKTLVSRFDRNLDAYRSGHYNETQVRLEFIDPFFKALGWDVHNEAGIAEAYKDVVHEATVKVGGATKAPDYSFRVGGTRKFFVEAKKPSVDIAHDIHPAYQLRRYAWSAKLPLSILTDFEEFAVYDCRVKPLKTDKAATARIMYLTFREYEERWSEITDILSRDAVWKGDFDRFVESKRKKRGTAEVDSAFLKEIENWRELLARNIALRNPDLTVYDMNFAVQRTIDRIIFLRICEDRSIVRYGQLREQLNGEGIYSKLCRLFKRADERFNSGLFHFRKEKDRESTPDTLTLNLAIDDKPLKEIITHLYYPECPYEFSVLPTEILGHVYEQFLGKVIRLTTAHRAKVEEKPEVRKAGGVYYTPTYIVDYIVKNTVGKLLEDRIVTSSRGAGKTHLSALVPAQAGNNVKEVKPKEVSKLKIVDPACGSGSFLIGAYQCLLDWHRDYYIKKGPGRFKDKIQPAPGGDWRLTTTEKKRILLNNIYGVDIDPQAVEVTKLSLLLKVLEGESEETIDSQLKFFHERALPDLSQNIKCGNSLIGPDFYENEQLSLLDEEERYRINAFDWEAEFPEIIKRGGFDAVIGNPPYIAFQEGSRKVKEYYKRYKSAIGKYDQYILFVEKSLSLTQTNGYFGFIIPNKFVHSDYGIGIKEIILGTQINEIVDFNDMQIFSGATNYPCILIVRKTTPANSFEYKRVLQIQISEIVSKSITIDQNSLSNRTWLLIDRKERDLIEKIKGGNPALGSISKTVTQGLRTGQLKVFFNNIDSLSVERIHIEKELIKLVFHGKNIKRYTSLLDEQEDLLLFPYLGDNRTPVNIDRFPNALDYLKQFKTALQERRDSGRVFKNTDKTWFEYWDSKPICFESPKIVFPDISNQNNFYLDIKGTGYLNTCYGIFLKDDSKCHYILGILNSRLIEFFIKRISPFVRGGFYRYKTKYVEQLPIQTIDFSDPTNKSRHDKMVRLVESILELNKQLAQAKTPHDREVLQRQIDATDRQINRLVYELYELTEEEIKIVEGG